MYNSGYVTTDENMFLRVPNKEVNKELLRIFSDRYTSNKEGTKIMDAISQAFILGRVEDIKKYLGDLIMKDISSFDREQDPHYYIMGITYYLINFGYVHHSNVESGSVRLDIVYHHAKDERPHFIVEIKYKKDAQDEELLLLAKEGLNLNQIEEKSYKTFLNKYRVKQKIYFYSIAVGKSKEIAVCMKEAKK